MVDIDKLVNRRVVLKSRPVGVPQAEHFAVQEARVPALAEGQVLVRIEYLSVDPAMRGWVNAAANYAEPVAIGAVMKSYAVGRIAASRHPAWKVGTAVSGLFGWQQWAVLDVWDIERRLGARIFKGLPISTALGVLGLTGATAYFGLLEIGLPRPGQTVVVSSAAGAVGSCVGQIARLAGCRTVGIAGGAEKTELCKDSFGFDAVVDYKASMQAGTLAQDVEAACPNGVDIYFDNTSGPITDAVCARINTRSRIIICGTVAHIEWDPPPTGPRIERKLMVTRSRMEGFIVVDYQHRWDEAFRQLADWIRAGRLTYLEEVLEGIDEAPDSIAGLYRGDNFGKRLIRVAMPDEGLANMAA